MAVPAAVSRAITHKGAGAVMTSQRVRMPSIKDVASVLRSYKPGRGEYQDEYGNDGIDVRLQVMPGGGWAIHRGDASYDQDHRGYWGAGFLTPATNCRELAKDLIGEAADQAAMDAE